MVECSLLTSRVSLLPAGGYVRTTAPTLGKLEARVSDVQRVAHHDLRASSHGANSS
jgi:hypothetical protein